MMTGGDWDYWVDDYLDGYDVVITPDDDDSDDDTWWRTEESDDNYENDNDDDPQGWNDDESSSSVGGSTTTGKPKPSSKPYVIKDSDKTVLENPNQLVWKPQESPMSCVPTAMDYAARITEKSLTETNYRQQFSDDYKIINPRGNIVDEGVLKDEFERFIKYEFDASTITSYPSIQEAINNDHSVLGIIESNSRNPWDLVEHAITIIGYTDDGQIIYIDPGDGDYKTVYY